MVTSASVQDRDGPRPALAHLRDPFASISLVWADGGHAGRLVPEHHEATVKGSMIMLMSRRLVGTKDSEHRK
ncbi:hypothetical protein [Streptomyces mirabilis]|jgi:hypothetical protein|uniref:Uncharacterized protein n=1 Tax=Streptomyces mirabilis TaxID=68239 RepID=A0A1I2JVI4_9ACTN|nr:hypothetical protein [Streptomyces mirabilis]SFF58113.1 hypothetical protein SAMN02787118_10915 [Streptomyces mirabilis]